MLRSAAAPCRCTLLSHLTTAVRPAVAPSSSRRAFTSASPRPSSYSSPNRAFSNSDRPPRPKLRGGKFEDSYLLSDKIKKLAKLKEFDAAIDLVKSSPAANVVVWNLLIHEVLLDRKFKRAYELWMDMKRRGLRPTARSFSTFFSGFAKISEIEGAALARVKTVYAQWQAHAEVILAPREGKKAILDSVEGEDGPEDITCIPTNAYLTFLSNTGNLDVLLETFEALPTSGPLKPDSMAYSIVFSALRASKDENAFTKMMGLWKKMSESVELIDTKTVSIVISICRDAKRPDDQKVGLELAKVFYGFVDPKDGDLLVSGKLAAPRVKLDSAGLSNVLSLALAMQKYNLAVDWFDQVRDYPKRFGTDVLDHHQCDLVLFALSYKHDAEGAEDLINWMRRSPRHLRPTITSYSNAIQVCWRSVDLTRANRLLSLMTGRPLPNQNPTATDPLLPVPPPSSLPNFQPDERIMSTMLQTALATRDRGDIYRTIELAESYNFGPSLFSVSPSSSLNDDESQSDANPPPPAMKKSDLTNSAFWKYKLAEVFERSLERVLQGGEKQLTSERRRELAAWRVKVVDWLDAMGAEDKLAKAEKGGLEESMRGRREWLKERDAKREGNSRKSFFGNEEKKDESPGGVDPWRSDEGRENRSKEWGARGSSASNSSSIRKEPESDLDLSGRSREDYRTTGNYSTPSFAPPPPSSTREPQVETPRNDEDQKKWLQAPVEEWPVSAPKAKEERGGYEPRGRGEREEYSRSHEERGGGGYGGGGGLITSGINSIQMATQFTLHTHAKSPNGWKADIALKALGVSDSPTKPSTSQFDTAPFSTPQVLLIVLPLRLRFLDFDISEQKGAEFTSLTPNGRIPVLVDHSNSRSIWESNAILLYLAEKYDTEAKISSQKEEEKDEIVQWLFFQASGQGPYYGQVMHFSFEITPENPYALERYTREMGRVFQVLENVLSKKPFLVGEKPTIADISFIPWNAYALDGLLSGGVATARKDYPAVIAWHEKLLTVDFIKEGMAQP